MNIDSDAKFLESHEWVKKLDGNIFTIGLSAYAIEQLGDIAYIELPQPGEQFSKGDPFGVVESVKSASDMYMPISGSIVDANSSLIDNPDILKTDAYNEGWILKIEASDESELNDLMDAAAYEAFLETQSDE